MTLKVLRNEVDGGTCWYFFVHQYGIGIEETRYGCHNKANKILFKVEVTLEVASHFKRHLVKFEVNPSSQGVEDSSAERYDWYCFLQGRGGWWSCLITRKKNGKGVIFYLNPVCSSN